MVHDNDPCSFERFRAIFWGGPEDPKNPKKKWEDQTYCSFGKNKETKCNRETCMLYQVYKMSKLILAKV